jgi:2-polyprenyl-3-methyl-5-hydroxy-6-metoxy-1,4-benzoquinol methylase
MRQIIQNYSVLTELKSVKSIPMGDSVSPKGVIFHILENNAVSVDILDVGFGTGGLGRLLKSTKETSHWNVDGIDGWETNCLNEELFEKNIYRNIWHGLAQELPSEVISQYKIICLLDVIEHLNAETAKWLFRTLLTNMGEDSNLFISTPLWFYPQNQQQDGDLEEHLIGVPASSMMTLMPVMYSISNPLIGGFVYTKRSLNYIDFFQPTTDKNFSYERGMNIMKILNIPAQSGVVYKTNI